MKEVFADHIVKFLSLVIEPGQVVEVRALNVGERWKRTWSGYFDEHHLPQLAQQVLALKHAEAVYFTPNPVDTSLLARSANRLRELGKDDPTTSDHEITRRRWLLVDVDPCRAKGISSSERQHEAALLRAQEIADALTERGWPRPVRADSGNGAHLMYRIDLPADDAAEALVHRCLYALAAEFSGEVDEQKVKVDVVVSNASRIWKLPGTMARKGSSTPERPHRRARVKSRPSALKVVTLEQLAELAALAPADTPEPKKLHQAPSRPSGGSGASSGRDGGRWLEDYVRRFVPDAKGPKAWKSGSVRYTMDCVWNPDHKGGCAFVAQHESGKYTAGCRHNSCEHRRWEDFRDQVEPGWREARAAREEDYQNSRLRAQPEGGKEPQTPIRAAPAKRDNSRRGVARAGERMKIQVCGERLRDLSDNALEALEAANDPPVVFVGADGPSRIVASVDGDVAMQAFSRDAMLGRLDRIADWWDMRFRKGEEPREVVCRPPVDVVNDLLALPFWPFPPLEGITGCPVFGADGTLADQPGYNAGARVWYEPPEGLSIPAVSRNPSDEELAEARAVLLQPFREFPFVEESSRAHCVAGVLLPFGRRLVRGPTPLQLITSSQAGSGKGLICDVTTMIATGRPSKLTPWTRDDEELRKKVTSILLEGTGFIHFDNLPQEYNLDSGTLAALLTAYDWSDRILGRSESVRLKVQVCWMMTAINPILSTELARRAVLVRLEPEAERPWERTFHVEDLLLVVERNRALLIWAALTAWQAWLARGRRPWKAKRMASFESWSSVLGGVLETLGVPGFLGNQGMLFESAEKDLGPWRSFVAAWWREFRGAPVGVKSLFRLCSEEDLLPDTLGNGNERSQKSKLGRGLMGAVGRVIGGFVLKRKGEDGRGAGSYCLVPVDSHNFSELRITSGDGKLCEANSDGISDSGDSTYLAYLGYQPPHVGARGESLSSSRVLRESKKLCKLCQVDANPDEIKDGVCITCRTAKLGEVPRSRKCSVCSWRIPLDSLSDVCSECAVKRVAAELDEQGGDLL